MLHLLEHRQDITMTIFFPFSIYYRRWIELKQGDLILAGETELKLLISK